MIFVGGPGTADTHHNNGARRRIPRCSNPLPLSHRNKFRDSCAPPPQLHRPTYVVVVVVVCTTITAAAADDGRFHMCVSNTPRRRRTPVRGTRVRVRPTPAAAADTSTTKYNIVIYYLQAGEWFLNTQVFITLLRRQCSSVSAERRVKTDWNLNRSRDTARLKRVQFSSAYDEKRRHNCHVMFTAAFV